MSEKTITIEVNGKTINAEAGAMLIEATDAAGIEVPRFCYHKKLSVAANCRMCLVEVEKVPKALPACSTPVYDNMKVWTHSEKAVVAQQDVMEFLLINHPLDCPICDQGGECELQDVSVAYGSDKSWFSEEKRVVFDKNIGPLISTELTRCIQCTRCVRFGEEIAGMRELGMVGRGDREKIDVFVNQSVQSELSGNAIDICPVGALTAKPSRFKARAWEIMQHAAIGSHDSVGSNLYHHTFNGELIRTVPRDNDAVNECWISDRDRFSYEGIQAEERVTQPMIKKNGQWVTVDWEEALQTVIARFKRYKPENMAGLASPRATLEELYLFQKLLRGLGCHNIDHRLRQTDDQYQEQAPLFPWLGVSIEALEQQNAVLLIGSNARFEQPLINHRLRKAAINHDAQIMSVNAFWQDFNFDAGAQYVTHPKKMVSALAEIALALGVSLPKALSDLSISEPAQAIAEQLKTAKNTHILLGNLAAQHPAYHALQQLAHLIAEASQATFGYLPEAANSAGAWLVGAVPHRLTNGEPNPNAGKSANDILSSAQSQCLVLLDIEPDYDCANPQAATHALKQAECVIAINSFANYALKEQADIILPASVITETSGTLVNLEGRWQSFKGASKAPAQVRPTWKILRVLGNMLKLDGFDYMSSDEIRGELKANYDEHLLEQPLKNQCSIDTGALNTITINHTDTNNNSLQRIGNVAMYAGDSLLRRAKALQKTVREHTRAIRMHPNDAQRLGVENASAVVVAQGDYGENMSLILDDKLPLGCVTVLAGTDKSAKLGAAFGQISISKISSEIS
ncbi:MAG: NADH-quinone oxidoreductase subunit NuoG [bacterium]